MGCEEHRSLIGHLTMLVLENESQTHRNITKFPCSNVFISKNPFFFNESVNYNENDYFKGILMRSSIHNRNSSNEIKNAFA